MKEKKRNWLGFTIFLILIFLILFSCLKIFFPTIPLTVIIIIAFFVVMFIVMYMLLKPEIRKPEDDQLLASSEWATEKQQKSFFGSTNFDLNDPIDTAGCPINELDDKTLLYEKENVHTLGLGSTRSGKSRKLIYVLVMLLIKAGESAVFNDPKKEFYRRFHKLFEKFGFKTWVLDFRNLQYSNCYNILQPVIDYFKEDNVEDADQAAQDIVTAIVTDNGTTEPIWIDGQKALAKALILANTSANVTEDKKNTYSIYQTMNVLGEERKFSDSNTPKTLLTVFFDSMEETDVARIAYTPIKNAPERTRGSFITSALSTLQIFSSMKLGKALSRSDFNFKDFAEDKSVLFIVNPDEKPTYNRVFTVIIDQMYQTLVEVAMKRKEQELKKPVHVIVDEAGNTGKINNIATKLTVSLSRGIRWYLFVQDYLQLDTLYDPNISKTIRSNCNLQIFISSADYDTCEDMSRKIGSKQIWLENPSGNYNDHASVTGGGYSYSRQTRALIDPNEMMQMDNRNGHGILIYRTYSKPLQVYLPDASAYPFYKELEVDFEEVERKDQKLTYSVPRFFIALPHELGIKSNERRKPNSNLMMQQEPLTSEKDLYWFWSMRDDLSTAVKAHILTKLKTGDIERNRKSIQHYLNTSKEFLEFITAIDIEERQTKKTDSFSIKPTEPSDEEKLRKKISESAISDLL